MLQQQWQEQHDEQELRVHDELAVRALLPPLLPLLLVQLSSLSWLLAPALLLPLLPRLKS